MLDFTFSRFLQNVNFFKIKLIVAIQINDLNKIMIKVLYSSKSVKLLQYNHMLNTTTKLKKLNNYGMNTSSILLKPTAYVHMFINIINNIIHFCMITE